MFVNLPKNCNVGINRNFSPEPRVITNWELLHPQDVTEAMTSFHYTDSLEQTFEKSNKGGMTARTHMLPTVVKKKHFWESGIAWDNPQEGRKASYLYYNIDKETDRILDEGEVTPYIYEWLKKKNSSFQGSYGDLLGDCDSAPSCYLRNPSVRIVNGVTEIRPFSDYSYNGHPILWVLDNFPSCMTNSEFLLPEDSFLKLRSASLMPVTMEEVKSIYVSDNPNAWRKFLPAVCRVTMVSPNGEEKGEYMTLSNIATVFVYTHKMFTKCPKGLRRTYFEGYSPSIEFNSPEYGELPANEDFRRTLYWNPYVKTDKDGNVDLKICNTGTCKQLIISAEAITPQGKVIKN